jgi:adenylate kinase family enzyme
MNISDYSNVISVVKKKNKINFIGPPGSGKTTLCRKISKELKLELIELDHILFDESCKVKNNKNNIVIKQLQSSPKCIVDGTYYSLLSEERVKETDLFIMLKINFFITFYRILKRSIFNKEFMCAERLNFRLINFLFTYYFFKKRLIMNLIPKDKLLIIKIN